MKPYPAAARLGLAVILASAFGAATSLAQAPDPVPRPGSEAPPPLTERTSERERDIFLYLALKAQPEHAIKRLREEYPTDPKAAECIHLLESIGKPCEFRFTALDGRKVDSRDYRGKVICILFWSEGCHDAAASLQQLTDFAARMKPQGLEAIGVCLDRDRAGVETMIKRYAVEWPQHFDGRGIDGEMARRFMAAFGPAYVLIDRRGNLRFLRQSLDSGDGGERIMALLAEPPPRR